METIKPNIIKRLTVGQKNCVKAIDSLEEVIGLLEDMKTSDINYETQIRVVKRLCDSLLERINDTTDLIDGIKSDIKS